MHHFRIEIRQDDQVLIMPRGLIPQTLVSEAERVLQGMQQLPDRLSSLIVRLRERGVAVTANGWLAMQVLKTMTEYVATDRSQRLRGRRKGGDGEADPGYSEELVEPDAVNARGAAAGGRWGLGRSARSAAAGSAIGAPASAGMASTAASASQGSSTAAPSPSSAAAGAEYAGTATGTGPAVTSSASSGSHQGSQGRTVSASGTSVAPYRTSTASGQPVSASRTMRPPAGGRPGARDDRRESGPPPWLANPAVRILLLALLLVLIAGGIYFGYRALRPGNKQPTATTAIGTTAAPTTIAATTARPTPTLSPAPTTTATTAPRVTWYVISRRLNVRAEANSTSKLIRTLTIGQPLYVLEQAGKDWTRIQTAEGETGYVFTSYISKNKPAG